MQAVILVGGLGKRLLPLTLSTPKPLVDVGGRTFLDRLVTQLKHLGVSRVILLGGYKHEQFENWLDEQDIGVPIDLHISPTDFSPIERLRAAWSHIDHEFILCYGDNYIEPDPLHFAPLLPNSAARFLCTKKTPGNVNLGASGLLYSVERSTRNQWVELGFTVFKKSALEAYLSSKSLGHALEGLTSNVMTEYSIVDGYKSISDPQRLEETRQYFQRKILFLDRDGILNKSAPRWEYISHVSQLSFADSGAIESLRDAQALGWHLAIVSNQAGVARGMLNEGELHNVTHALTAFYKGEGVTFDGIFYCKHGWDEGCECRKPKAGLFIRSASTLDSPLSNCWVIGDQCSDVIPLVRMGGQGVHVVHSERPTLCQCEHICDSFEEAVKKVMHWGGI